MSAISASPALVIAGAGPRLDHGGALPGPPFPLVVVERRRGRDSDLRRSRIRPQPQIDAKHIAVAGALLQQPRKRLRDAHEERLRLDVRRQRRRCGIEKHDQIDVAGVVQFARAHLAHREHDQAAAVLGPVEVGRQQPPARGLLPQQKAQRRLHRGDRELGQRRRHLHRPARPRRCRTARSAAPLPISCGAADRIASASLAAADTSRAGILDQSRQMPIPARIPAAEQARRRRRAQDRKDKERPPRYPSKMVLASGNAP